MAHRNTITDLDDLLQELDSSQFDSKPAPSNSPPQSRDMRSQTELESLVEKFEVLPQSSSNIYSEPAASKIESTPQKPPVQFQPTPMKEPTPSSQPVPQITNNNNNDEPQNRQSVYVSSAPSGSGFCAKCHQNIVGEHVLALGKMWHTNHLKCSTCDKDLQGEFFDHNDNYICKQCMERDFKCSKCHQPITGEYFTGNGLKLHPHCVTRNSCHKCGLEIPGGEISALGNFWHTSCFSCYNCSKPLGTTFYPKNNEPYCQECVSGNSGGNKTTCHICGNPISGSYVSYQNKNYHDNCFKCAGCANVLDSTQFYNINNNPHCYSCAHK